jgi:tRNA-2-methylthio-N6-dimethylallyladenosine synthase
LNQSDTNIQKQYEYINMISNRNLQFREINGRFPRATVEWFGCQMNQRDTETLLGMFENMNYEYTEDVYDADLVIFNTCSVREHAENKMYGKLGTLKTVKKTKNPDLVVGICGCMTQKKGAAEEIFKKYRHVDLIFGTHNLYAFPELLYKVLESKKHVIEIWDIDGEVIEDLPVRRENNLKAWVSITYGCNNFCTYCIVPYVRGRERHRKVEDIVKEVKELASEGFKEITLLGQNVNSYGTNSKNSEDGDNKSVTFPELLKILNEIDGIERIRFMTPHPKDLSDELIEVVKNNKKICNHIHLPLQSGSSRVLKTMNRHYTKEQYLALVEKIKREIPNVAISADIIVGFPGETEEDFLDTLDVFKKVQYDLAYTFIYSKRPGTPAENMIEQIDDDVKHDRLNRLIELQNEICLNNNKKLKGEIVEVLVDGLAKNPENCLVGRTDNNKIVNFIGDKELIGKIVNVRITEGEKFWLRGELV